MSFTQTYINHEGPQNATLNNARCIDDKSKGNKELKRKSELSKECAAIQPDGSSSDGQSTLPPIETEDGFKRRRDTAKTMVQNVRSKKLDYFKYYFGAENESEMNKIKSNYSTIETNLPSARFEVAPDRDLHPTWYAYVNNHQQPIYLCNLYRSAGESGRDSKPGVIVHEESHIDLKTKDHIYKLPAIFANGSLTKEKAMENAETYEYAAENAAGYTGQ